jgi:hypothetical protein
VLWSILRSPKFSAAELEALQSAVDWLDGNAAAIASHIADFSIREEDFGNPDSTVVSEAIRCIGQIDPYAPQYVDRPKSSRVR